MGFAHVDSCRAVDAALVIVEHGEAQSVEGLGDAAELVAGLLPQALAGDGRVVPEVLLVGQEVCLLEVCHGGEL